MQSEYTEKELMDMVESITESLPYHQDYIPVIYKLVCSEGISVFTDLIKTLKATNESLMLQCRITHPELHNGILYQGSGLHAQVLRVLERAQS